MEAEINIAKGVTMHAGRSLYSNHLVHLKYVSTSRVLVSWMKVLLADEDLSVTPCFMLLSSICEARRVHNALNGM